MIENKNFIVKICGVNDQTEAQNIFRFNPTMIGLIFVPESPRFVEINTAREISGSAHAKGILVVGVFQNQNPVYVLEIIKTVSLDYVQLHGEEDMQYCSKMNIPVIKKIILSDSVEELKSTMSEYSGTVNYFLIDRPVQGQGETVDLKTVKELTEDYPVIIAGGLNKDNIEMTINGIGKNLRGVDTCSGVENKPGVKDLDLVQSFISNAGSSHELYKTQAQKMDDEDMLSHFKNDFYFPQDNIYMNGNSLGLLSKRSEHSLLEVIDSWKTKGINGWTQGDDPWFYMAEKLSKMIAPLVGALPEEIIVSSSASVNLHQLLATFFKPEKNRTKILTDSLAFPSDIYALKSHLILKGLNPEEHLKIVKSRDGNNIHEDDIIAAMTEDVSLILLPTVIYSTGQLLDYKKITAEARKRNITIGFDLCHSIGIIPHELHKEEMDFAFFCNYKYLNGGPGSAGGLFIHKKHFGSHPGLAGWFSSDKKVQFDMKHELVPAEDAGAYQIGTPHILSMAPLLGSLAIFEEAGIQNIHEKSMKLTGFLCDLIETELAGMGFSIGTPNNPYSRGGHIALIHEDAPRICKSLKLHGIIPDFRPPNIIRLAPSPLYVSFTDVFEVVKTIKEIMLEKDYKKFANRRELVA